MGTANVEQILLRASKVLNMKTAKALSPLLFNAASQYKEILKKQIASCGLSAQTTASLQYSVDGMDIPDQPEIEEYASHKADYRNKFHVDIELGYGDRVTRKSINGEDVDNILVLLNQGYEFENPDAKVRGVWASRGVKIIAPTSRRGLGFIQAANRTAVRECQGLNRVVWLE